VKTQFEPARRRIGILRENMLFFSKNGRAALNENPYNIMPTLHITIAPNSNQHIIHHAQ
jgi:hypothetical protein